LFDLRTQLSAHAQKFFEQNYSHSTDVFFDIQMEEGRGDFTTSIALTKAKELKISPHIIAERLAESLRTLEGVESAAVAGAGFVNVSVTSTVLLSALSSVQEAMQPKALRGEAPVIVEYSSPNIAKPFGIHHIITTVLGQVLANFYRHAGYKVIAINHIGDWGTQFGKLSVAFHRWGQKKVEECSLDDLFALYVRFHEEVEANPSLDDDARKAFAALEQGDEAMRDFWRVVVQTTMSSLDAVYTRLSVHFDETIGESFYENRMQVILDEGKQNGVFTLGREGALITVFPEDSLPPALVVQRSILLVTLRRFAIVLIGGCHNLFCMLWTVLSSFISNNYLKHLVCLGGNYPILNILFLVA
jgi:arginyl-tRNA synthetase